MFDLTEDPEGQPVVWIVDPEQWPRANLRAELIERGYDAVGHVDLAPALAALTGVRPRRPRVIVLELRGQSITASQMKQLASSGVAVVMIGGAVELREPWIGGCSWGSILKRPVTLGEVADTVDRIMAAQGSSPQ